MADDRDERLDVLAEDGNPTGETKIRAEVHRDGDWHRTFHLWIVKEGRYVLLQRRSGSKDLEPNKVDVSVGGHLEAGETLLDVVREVEEEIGLAVRPGDLHFLFERRAERTYPDVVDREVQEVYVLRHEQPLEHYGLACDEVFALYEIDIERAITLYREGGFAAVSGFDCMARENNALLIEDDLIDQGRDDVVAALTAIQGWLASAPGAELTVSSR